MDRTSLERRLDRLRGFSEPRVEFEQYATPADVAAHLLHVAAMRGDLAGRTVVDLGAGTGMLGLGAALSGAERVVGVERDPNALAVAHDNERLLTEGESTPVASVEWVLGDVAALPLCPDADEEVTVISNPPFGAQRGAAGADRPFLAAAAGVARVSYSVHNAGSRAFVERFAADRGGTVTDAFAVTLSLGRQYPHHTEARADVPTEAFRIEW